MMDSSRCSDVLGRDCPHLEEHVAHSCQLRGDGSWNKWRGPALRGEVTVYAAKARRHSIDQRARCVRVGNYSNPALLTPIPSHFYSGTRVVIGNGSSADTCQ